MTTAQSEIGNDPQETLPFHEGKAWNRAGILLFLLLFVSYGYIAQDLGANANSRLDLLHALFVQHQIAIDRYAGNTMDRATINGHFYSDKAPGGVVIAMPSFAVLCLLYQIAGWDIDALDSWNTVAHLTTLFSVGLLSAVAGVAAYSLFGSWIGGKLAFIAAVGAFLGYVSIVAAVDFGGRSLEQAAVPAAANCSRASKCRE